MYLIYAKLIFKIQIKKVIKSNIVKISSCFLYIGQKYPYIVIIQILQMFSILSHLFTTLCSCFLALSTSAHKKEAQNTESGENINYFIFWWTTTTKSKSWSLWRENESLFKANLGFDSLPPSRCQTRDTNSWIGICYLKEAVGCGESQRCIFITSKDLNYS